MTSAQGGVSVVTPRSAVAIVIAMVPPRACSPNARGHWGRKHEASTQYRMVARAAANLLDGRALGDGQLIMDIDVAWCCGRQRMDDDNLIAAVKPARDGVADAFFGGDDSRIRVGAVTQRRGGGVTTLTLRGAG